MPSKRIYLITGSTGFVGSCLLRRLLNRGEKVHILLRKQANIWRIKDIMNKAKIHISDLSNAAELKNIFKKTKPTVIYHLATYGAYTYQDNVKDMIKTNISGTWNMLNVLNDFDFEVFVNTGSSSEYGFKKKPMRETDLLKPVSYYAVTKSSQTLLCSYFANSQKKSIVTLRPFSVYGPYEEPKRFIPTLMRALYFKKKIDLVNSDISRDQVYVDDFVDVYLLVDKLKKYPGEIFNVGTGVQSSIKDVVEAAVRITGRTTAFHWGKMNQKIWDTTYWVADISKTKKLLNWNSKINLEKGLSFTWRWFCENYRSFARL